MSHSTAAHDRYIKVLADFENILFAEPTGDLIEHEASLMPDLEKIFPGASPLMCRAALRLVTGFAKSFPDFMIQIIPGHVNLLMNYGWADTKATGSKKIEVTEGVGAFWLFKGSNSALDAIEAQAIPALSPYFHLNQFRPLAVRAWLRLQAVYFDPNQVEALLMLWNEHYIDTEVTFFVPREDFLPVAGEEVRVLN